MTQSTEAPQRHHKGRLFATLGGVLVIVVSFIVNDQLRLITITANCSDYLICFPLTRSETDRRASSGRDGSPNLGTMIASDGCPRDDNQIIQLEPGDRVQIYQRIGPVSQEDRNLPPDSPLSKKMNLSYIKVLGGLHAGEYCWASTVNIR
jgi:hypothetical protein